MPVRRWRVQYYDVERDNWQSFSVARSCAYQCVFEGKRGGVGVVVGGDYAEHSLAMTLRSTT